jgi:hypothetical protein
MSKNFAVNKLKIYGNKNQTLCAIALILILTISAIMASMPTTNAHSPAWNVQTYAFLTASPSPVGLGQTVTVVFWLSQVPPTANGIYGDRWGNMTVAVTKPDGTTQTLGPFTSDPVGSGYCFFVPDKVGTYTLQFKFAGQVLAGSNPNPSPLAAAYTTSPFIGDYFQPSTSPQVTLIVQQQQIQPYPAAPLPTGYWQRPINSLNREWYTLSGNWLGSGAGSFGASFFDAHSQGSTGGNFAPYTTAPNSAHIVWTKVIAFGGIIGGEYGGGGTSSYYTGSNYENRLCPPIIIQGRLYYNTPSPPLYGFYCVDLRTGETIWWHNSTGDTQPNLWNNNYAYTGIQVGQIYNYISPNQYGGTPYLWGINALPSGARTYSMYDAFTGNWILNIVNASSGTILMSPAGDMLVYVLDAAHNWLAMWNSSLAIPLPSSLAANGFWMWRPPLGATLNWINGIQWNVTTPSVAGQSIKQANGDALLSTAVPSSSGSIGYQMEIAYSPKDGHTLWGPINRTLTIGGNWGLQGPIGDGVFTEYDENTMTWSGYSLSTGQKLWGPTDPLTNAWGMYMVGTTTAYGKLYSLNLDGLHCYDLQTGKHLWDYSAGSSGLETAYGIWPFDLGGLTVADGKVFIVSGHGHVQPLFRGSRLYAIDAQTGKELWSILGNLQSSYCSPPAIADGYLVTYNEYDGQLYCFGKGQTATTVTVTPGVGNVVTIQGMVTDQSPGQTSLGISAAGTPAVSDASMEQWMEYLYEQQPMPKNATGVTVTLDSIDPNNNFVHIGNATSDLSGLYSYMWTPPIPGKYTIIATFQGSNSYYASYSETAIGVASAVAHASTTTPPSTTPSSTGTPAPTSAVSPSVAPTPTQPASSAAPSMTLYIAAAAAIIIIAVVAAAVVLRRRK